MQRENMQFYSPFSQVEKGLARHQFHHKIKLSLLFILPLLVFFSSPLFQIDKLSTRSSQLANLERLTKLTIELSNLLHNLQKERGYSGVFITSNGGKFKAELAEQRERVKTNNTNIYNLFTPIAFITNVKFKSRFEDFNKQFTELEQIHLKIDSFIFDESKAIDFYNQLNQKLLGVLSAIVQLTVDSELTQAFSAYTLFLRGKESVAIERGRFSVVFDRGYFLNNEYNELVKIGLEQEIYFDEFSELASESLYKPFNALFQVEAFKVVQQMKSQALANAVVNGRININVLDWFDITTHKIDQLDLFANKISSDLLDNASRLRHSSEQEIFYWQTALISLYVITLGLGIWLITHIHRTEISKIKEYQGLFSKNSAAMVVVHAKSQNILYGNQSFSNLVGYQQQQLANLNVINFHSKDDIERILSIFKNIIPGEVSVTEKVLFIRKDNKVFFADIFAFLITIDKQEYIAAHIVDITSKLQAEQHIQQSEQTLNMILDSINSAVVALEGASQTPVYMNKKALEIYYSKEDNESLRLLFRQDFFSSLNDDFTNKSIVKKQYFNKATQRWYQITSNIIDWSDGRTVCLKMLKDITENYDAEQRNNRLLVENRQLLYRNYLLIEQERKHIAKELHDELGQLLTGIKLQADFIARQADQKDQTLQSSAKSIVQATNGLIKSTRSITNNLRPIILDQLGIIDAIKELVENWRRLDQKIQFDLSLDNLPHELNDELQINVYRIIQEGITNACKHAGAQHIEINLQFIPSPYDKECFLLQLKIQDNGKGFKQNSEHYNGVGIINMRERTEALNGNFCVVNKQSQGVGILITIPLDSALQEELCH